MHLTNVLLKAPKSKFIMVLLQSTGSSHKITSFRERSAEKKEIIFFDPYIEMECVYTEQKKIRSMKRPLQITKTYNEDTYGVIPKELLVYNVLPVKSSSTKKLKTDESSENK